MATHDPTTTAAEPNCGTPVDPPGSQVASESEFPVQLSAKAVEKVVEALKLESEQTGKTYLGVRVSVVGGGCSGFQYGLDFVEMAEDDDLVADHGAAKVFCDRFSAAYLYGTRLDYVETLQGAGFKFDNPQAKRTCGCGASFSV
jgi:iron-sulfur cluster insertion protein